MIPLAELHRRLSHEIAQGHKIRQESLELCAHAKEVGERFAATHHAFIAGRYQNHLPVFTLAETPILRELEVFCEVFGPVGLRGMGEEGSQP